MNYGAIQSAFLEETGPWRVTFNLFRQVENKTSAVYGINYNFTDKYGNRICAGNPGRSNTFSCESHREFDHAYLVLEDPFD